MCEVEKWKIAQLDTFHNGYNLTEGGEGGSPSEETRRKISKALSGENHWMYGKRSEDHPMYGKQQSDEAKQKISENNAMKNRPEARQKHSETMKGKTLSEETRRKISETLKGTYAGENNPMYGKPASNKGKSPSEENLPENI